MSGRGMSVVLCPGERRMAPRFALYFLLRGAFSSLRSMDRRPLAWVVQDCRKKFTRAGHDVFEADALMVRSVTLAQTGREGEKISSKLCRLRRFGLLCLGCSGLHRRILSSPRKKQSGPSADPCQGTICDYSGQRLTLQLGSMSKST